MDPDFGSPSLRAEVGRLSATGVLIELVEAGGQCYVLAPALEAPAPPWDRSSYDILVAIPGAYDDAGLDAFYLRLPYAFRGGTHPRVQGAIIQVRDASWQLVSWHYPEAKAWARGLDSLETHLLHCKGFFLNRGALNAA
jgi:hypothetical protein